MSGPPAAVAAIRAGVRGALAQVEPGALVLVACSGGADSLALAAAVAFEAPRARLRAGAVVVDHALQDASAQVARRAGAQCVDLGLTPVDVVEAAVAPSGDGPEARARVARYVALERVADQRGADLVLLGHTRDDQAEQVLLGMLRGSGSRALSGMPFRRGRFLRPLLGIERRQTAAACQALGLTPWQDPHNVDPTYTRVRVRRWLEEMEVDLGPGLGAALARTAEQVRRDSEHLERLADEATDGLGATPYRVEELSGIPSAVRTRVWRRLLIRAGSPAGRLGSRHTDACDALLTDWHGQGPLQVPGPVQVSRHRGRITITPLPRVEWSGSPPPRSQE